MSQTPIANRLHISFFGCTNAGKSSVVNAITSQNLSVVSPVAGTTTDAVKKTMELLPLGPIVIYDTAGFDDKSEIGEKRIEKTLEVLRKTDVAILVVDAIQGMSVKDEELIKLFDEHKIPYLTIYNKADLVEKKDDDKIYVSAKTKDNIEELKEKIAKFVSNTKIEKHIIIDKLQKKDSVILVIPIDESAPKGRLILPQQNTLRELLDNGNIAICCQVEELFDVLENLKTPPKLVITDSQAFNKVKDIVPKDILLTSFSILFARHKGNLIELIKGAKKLSKLKNGDKVLISEGCTHHRQCNDIGTVKMPAWIEKYTSKKLDFEFSSGGEFPADLKKYSLIIHCGGCMLNAKEMQYRLDSAQKAGVEIVNYGIVIAYMNGILERALGVFPEINL
ncbi:[bacterium]|nr:[FeFe] hydrogenase H-cluster maturation GTPase HydF [bacterium]